MALIRFRRAVAAEWALINPILRDGEPGVDLTAHEIRVGDGQTAWADLPVISGPAGEPGPAGGPGADGPAGPPGVEVVKHGSNANVARPSTALVYWVGTATPANALATDWWLPENA